MKESFDNNAVEEVLTDLSQMNDLERLAFRQIQTGLEVYELSSKYPDRKLLLAGYQWLIDMRKAVRERGNP